MFVIANLINALATIAYLALHLYTYVIIARAILSWVNPNPFNPTVRSIIRIIYNITDPPLRLIRSKIPAIEGIDISPVILILFIVFLQIFVVQNLFDLALKLK